MKQWKWNFIDLAGICYIPKQHSLVGSNFQSFIDLWSKVLEQICMFQIKPCTENHHPQCYWPTINNYLLKICPQLPVLSLYFFEVVDLLNAKKWSHADLHWLDKLLFFILRFFGNVDLKIVIYYVSDTPSIARYWRSVLTFKFSVLNFLKLMSCSMSIEQKSC